VSLLTFNMLLERAGVVPGEVRLLRHQTLLADGRTPLELMRSSRGAFDIYQERQLHAQRGYFTGRYWASFVGLRDGRTLFAGLYEIGHPRRVTDEWFSEALQRMIPAGDDDLWPIQLSPLLQPFIERLFVEWGGGASGKRAWKQRADQQDKAVVELHLEAAEEAFPGLMQLVAPLSVVGEAPPGWMTALTTARGVYLLTCPRTGEAYVGSAKGEGGFWSRWMEYRANGHGGNVALIGRDPTDFTASILQVAGSAENADDILAAETLWKRKLETRRTGLNRN
jgi:hypothetical protein